MKVTQTDFEILKAAIVPFDTPAVRARYLAGDIPRAHLVKDLNKRYRWDLYYHATSQGNSLPDSTNGYNMDHIYTALSKIVPPLEGK